MFFGYRFHSYFKDFTGSAVAAFIAFVLTVSSAMIKANIPDEKKIHIDISVLYAKS